MENHNVQWVNQLSMPIFNSYVKLPEGLPYVFKDFEPKPAASLGYATLRRYAATPCCGREHQIVDQLLLQTLETGELQPRCAAGKQGKWINGRSPGSNLWRYVSTIFWAIFWGYIPLHSPYIGLIYVRYFQFRFLEWPLNGGTG